MGKASKAWGTLACGCRERDDAPSDRCWFAVRRWSDHDRCGVDIVHVYRYPPADADGEPLPYRTEDSEIVWQWIDEDARNLEWVCGTRDCQILDYWDSLGRPTD
jgi:hypothetical protein